MRRSFATGRILLAGATLALLHELLAEALAARDVAARILAPAGLADETVALVLVLLVFYGVRFTLLLVVPSLLVRAVWLDVEARGSARTNANAPP